MFMLINSFSGLRSSRAFQFVLVLGVAGTLTIALIGAASATPPGPCEF
jgi:hypothetical protein